MIQEILMKKEPIIYQSLKNALKNDRLAHTFLFEGVRGPLKVDAAFLLAQSIIEDKKDFACETCDRCLRIKRQEYFDVLYIDGQENLIVKEDIEHLFKEFNKTALERSGKKVYIINKIEHASLKVLNMILKFMEEPSNQNTYGIFITDHKDALLETIISRCQVLSFKSSNYDLYEKAYLDDGFEKEDAYYLARLHHRYQKMDLNDHLYHTAKDFVFLTIDHLKDMAYLPILFQHEFAGCFKKNESDLFKKCQDYYLDLLLIVIQDALVDQNNPLYNLSPTKKAKFFEIVQGIKDRSLSNIDRKLLFDQLAFEIISYRIGD